MVGAAHDVLKTVAHKIGNVALHRGKELQPGLPGGQQAHFLGQRFAVLGA